MLNLAAQQASLGRRKIYVCRHRDVPATSRNVRIAVRRKLRLRTELAKMKRRAPRPDFV